MIAVFWIACLKGFPADVAEGQFLNCSKGTRAYY